MKYWGEQSEVWAIIKTGGSQTKVTGDICMLPEKITMKMEEEKQYGL